METFNLIFLVIVVAIVVVGAVGMVAFLRRRPQPRVPPPPDGPVITRDEAASLADPETADHGTVDGIPPESEEPAAGTTTLERPESDVQPAGPAAAAAGALPERAGPRPARPALPRPARRRHVGGHRGHPDHRRRRGRARPRSSSSGCAPGSGSRAPTAPPCASILRDELLALVDPSPGPPLGVTGADGKPGVVLVVGVNGTGKTTTVGKLARVLVAEDKSVRPRCRRHVPGSGRRAARPPGASGSASTS